jgi:hypothetical protein
MVRIPPTHHHPTLPINALQGNPFFGNDVTEINIRISVPMEVLALLGMGFFEGCQILTEEPRTIGELDGHTLKVRHNLQLHSSGMHSFDFKMRNSISTIFRYSMLKHCDQLVILQFSVHWLLIRTIYSQQVKSRYPFNAKCCEIVALTR